MPIRITGDANARDSRKTFHLDERERVAIGTERLLARWRGREGRIRTVWAWDAGVTSVRFTPETIALGHRDGARDAHREIKHAWHVRRTRGQASNEIVLGGRVTMMFIDLAPSLSHFEAKSLKATANSVEAVVQANGKQETLTASHAIVAVGITGNVEYVLADAEALPFPDAYFDAVTMAFGLRNVTHKEQALASIHRVLKPGGRLVVLEFSKPVVPGLAPVYDLYSFRMLPLMGRLVANDADSYRYLAESIRMHPDQETLRDLMQAAGFGHVDVHNLTAGVVALHVGVKC